MSRAKLGWVSEEEACREKLGGGVGQRAVSAPVDTVSRGESQLVTLQRSLCSLAGVLAEDPSIFLSAQQTLVGCL